MEKALLLEILYKEQKKVSEALVEKRTALGEADSGKESRIPTGRNELEDQILILQNKLGDLKRSIDDLESTPAQVSSKVAVGSNVHVLYGAEEMSFMVTSFFVDPSIGVLSASSPLALALLGKEKGDEVFLKTEDGNVAVKVLDVS